MFGFFNSQNTKLRCFGIASVALVAMASGACGANAATVTASFNLRGSGGQQDFPNFILSNESEAGVEITHFNMTIGDTSYNFDRFYQHNDTGFFTPTNPGSGNAPISNLGTDNGGDRFDEIDISYFGFVAGTESNFRVEFDPDNTNDTVNPREILFNNGTGVPNSVITVSFRLNGVDKDLEYTIPELPIEGDDDNIYNFFASIEYQVSEVPLPASLPLFGAGLAIMGFASWRRKKKAST